jgi:hypothetical protein
MILRTNEELDNTTLLTVVNNHNEADPQLSTVYQVDRYMGYWPLRILDYQAGIGCCRWILQATNLERGFRTISPPNIFSRLVWAIHHFIFVSQSTNLYSIYTTYIHDKPYYPLSPHPVHYHLQSYKRKTLVRLELANGNGIIITIFCYTSWQTHCQE